MKINRKVTEVMVCAIDLENIDINPLNAELNPIWHLLALLRAHPILHISRIRVKMDDDALKQVPKVRCLGSIFTEDGKK